MDSALLTARIEDTAQICAKTSKHKFLGFLSLEETAAAEKILSRRGIRYELWGGYDGAQRSMLCCLPDWAESADFPITAITLNFRKSDVLRHRDFLGSLMGLGIKREAVGDILVEEGRAVIFVTTEISEFVLSELKKVGRTGVTAVKGFKHPLPESDVLIEASVTVASDRLDCVVAALARASRSAAAELISDGRVSVNSVLQEKPTKTVGEGDVITIRGNGKFIVTSTNGRTKKDRTVLQFKKYS